MHLRILEENIVTLENKNEHLNHKLFKMGEECADLNREKINIIDERDRLKSDFNNQVNLLNRNISDIKAKVNAIISNERFESHKFYNMVNNDNFKIFSKNFKDNIALMDRKTDINNHKDILEMLSLSDDFQKVILQEFEVSKFH